MYAIRVQVRVRNCAIEKYSVPSELPKAINQFRSVDNL
jgi:hypothetical protein